MVAAYTGVYTRWITFRKKKEEVKKRLLEQQNHDKDVLDFESKLRESLSTAPTAIHSQYDREFRMAESKCLSDCSLLQSQDHLDGAEEEICHNMPNISTQTGIRPIPQAIYSSLSSRQKGFESGGVYKKWVEDDGEVSYHLTGVQDRILNGAPIEILDKRPVVFRKPGELFQPGEEFWMAKRKSGTIGLVKPECVRIVFLEPFRKPTGIP